MTTGDKKAAVTASPTPTTEDHQRQEMRERAEKCGKEIEASCERHRCRVQPILNAADPVGNDGSRCMISAGWVIMPQA